MELRWLLGVLVVLCLEPEATAAEESGRPLLDVLPESALAYVHLDLAKALEKGPDLRLISMVSSDEVAPFLAPLWERALSLLGERAADLDFELDSYSLRDLELDLEGALLGLGAGVLQGEGGPVSFWLSVRSSEPARTLRALTELLGSELSFQAEVLDGHEVKRCFAGEAELFTLAAFDDRVLIAENSRNLLRLRDALGERSPQPRRLTEDDDFIRWRALIEEGDTVFEAYIALARLLLPLELVPGAQVTRELGLHTLRGFGAAVSIIDRDLRESMALLMPEERFGLLRLFDVLEPDPSLAERVLVDSDFVLADHIDWLKVLEVVEESLGDAGINVAEDGDESEAWELLKEIAASIGPGGTLQCELPTSWAFPEILLRIPVRDQARLLNAAQTAAQSAFGPSLRPPGDESTDLRPGTAQVLIGGTPEEPLSMGEEVTYEILQKQTPGGIRMLTLEMSSLDQYGFPCWSFTPSCAIHDGTLWFSESVWTLMSRLRGAGKSLSLRPVTEDPPTRDDVTNKARFPQDPVIILKVSDPELIESTVRFLLIAPTVPWLKQENVWLVMSDFPRIEKIQEGFSLHVISLSKRQGALLWQEQSAYGGPLSLYCSVVSFAFLFSPPSPTYLDDTGGSEAPAPVHEGQPIVGLQAVDATEDTRMRVESVEPGGSAERAGIQVDDELLAIDDEPVRNQADLGACVRAAGAGATVSVRLCRAGVILELPVTVAASSGQEHP